MRVGFRVGATVTVTVRVEGQVEAPCWHARAQVGAATRRARQCRTGGRGHGCWAETWGRAHASAPGEVQGLGERARVRGLESGLGLCED